MAVSLQRDKQLLDLVQFHIITRETRDVVPKRVARRAEIRNVMLSRHLPDAAGDRAFGSFGHGFYLAFRDLKIH
jgi:hypothetical protein